MSIASLLNDIEAAQTNAPEGPCKTIVARAHDQVKDLLNYQLENSGIRINHQDERSLRQSLKRQDAYIGEIEQVINWVKHQNAVAHRFPDRKNYDYAITFIKKLTKDLERYLQRTLRDKADFAHRYNLAS